MTWRTLLDRPEKQCYMSGLGGKLEECMRCQIQAVCSTDMRLLPKQVGPQLELRSQLPIMVGHWNLVVRAQEREDLVV